MITSDSRYAAAAHEDALTHLYDSLGNPETVSITDQVIPGSTVTAGTVTAPNLVTDPLTQISRDTLYLLTTAQGTVPPRTYMVKMTDNVQLLAYRTMVDPTRWWVIADANPHIRYPFDFVMGQTINLPE